MTKTLLIALTGSLLTFSSIHAKEVVTADVSQLSDMEVFGEVQTIPGQERKTLYYPALWTYRSDIIHCGYNPQVWKSQQGIHSKV